MALPSFAPENVKPAPPSALARVFARIKSVLAERHDSRLAPIRRWKSLSRARRQCLARAGVAGSVGALDGQLRVRHLHLCVDLGADDWRVVRCGLSSAARRFIPEYTELKNFDRLRGFLNGSRWLAFGMATAIGLVGAIGIYLLAPWLDHFAVIPLYLACLAIAAYGLVQVQAGIAQSYDWPNLALMPFYIWRQLIITVLMGAAWFFGAATDAVTAMIIAVITTWAVTIGQLALLSRRLQEKVPAGRKIYEPRVWFATSLPIFIVEGFYLLLTYVDIITLEHFRSPHDVAIYYAGARLLAIVAFVYFAIAGATTHKFSEYDIAGDRRRLASFFRETVHWTFWPSLAICAAILAFGRPLLSLFGAGFEAGYGVMFILAVGLLARASVRPAERLLNMIGERKQCATVYALAFAINLLLCVILIPRLGIEGAAAATSAALVAESLMFAWVTKKRLGFNIFVFGRPAD